MKNKSSLARHRFTAAAAMRFAHDFMGADRLLFASDHPWVEPKLILDALRSLQLPADEEARILGGTAQKLFGLKS